MRFNYVYSSREHRFAVGIDTTLNKYFISIPVNLGLVDSQEYYEISREEFDKVHTDINHLIELAQKCRDRKNDTNLYIQPGKSRGTPN